MVERHKRNPIHHLELLYCDPCKTKVPVLPPKIFCHFTLANCQVVCFFLNKMVWPMVLHLLSERELWTMFTGFHYVGDRVNVSRFLDEQFEREEVAQTDLLSIRNYRALEREKMQMLASYLDRDRDAIVTRQEVVEGCMTALLQRLFKALDLDGSGEIY